MKLNIPFLQHLQTMYERSFVVKRNITLSHK